MRYVSTRAPDGVSVSFEEAVMSGYAKDGGVYVPERLPEISEEEVEAWKELSYPALALAVLRPFVEGEIEDEVLMDMLEACYAEFATTEDVVKLRPISLGEGNVVKLQPMSLEGKHRICELFWGPTECFKDLGLGVLIRVVAYFAEKRRSKRVVLVSTTGDTGPACVHAAARTRSEYLRVVCTYPEGMVSAYQRSQMRRSPSTLVCAFQGGGDDMDVPFKKIGADRSDVSGCNSYNVCRPLAQMVHFIWIMLRMPKGTRIAVPTGAMGNLAALIMAKLRLPESAQPGNILAACNPNDFAFRAIESGDVTRSDRMLSTVSDAINIQIPYNFERVLYYAYGDASPMIDVCRQRRGSSLALPSAATDAFRTFGLKAATVSDASCLDAIRTFASPEYIPDPHAAVAIAAAQSEGWLRAESPPCVVIATAHARKFRDVVRPQVGPDLWAAYVGALENDDPITPPGSDHLLLAKRPSETLADAQLRWEAAVRALLDETEWHRIVAVDEADHGNDDPLFFEQSLDQRGLDDLENPRSPPPPEPLWLRRPLLRITGIFVFLVGAAWLIFT